MRFIAFLLISLSCKESLSQSVVVNGYINYNDYRDEWTELLVVGDNVDMRNWTIRDNNGTQTSWQTPVRFNNIPFWQNMRRGTVIMLWHRHLSSAGIPHPTDTDPSDGYIEIDLQNTTYFFGGDFNTNNTMNLNSTSDIVQLRNAANVHIHALGHGVTPGANWTALPSPKLNHANSTNNGDAIYVCPGSVLSEYDGPSGTTLTSRNNTTTTFGLPNTCLASIGGNRIFWRELRKPEIASQTVFPTSVIAGFPGSISFSWTAALDPYPADNTIGYMILRNTTNSFPVIPFDGTTYPVGSMLGGATVIAEINNSATTSFTDNTVMSGNSYYYRVYAFRYATDNINGNSYDNARGRAYNETDFVFVDWPTPGSALPVNLLFFSGKASNHKVILSWSTHSEINNSHFIIEKSSNGNEFTFLVRKNGHGTTSQQQWYFAEDDEPFHPITYYRLSQVDFDGTIHQSKMISVKLISTLTSDEINLSLNPAQDETWLSVNSDEESAIEISIYDINGRTLLNRQLPINVGMNAFRIALDGWLPGMYFLSAKSKETIKTFRFIKY